MKKKKKVQVYAFLAVFYIISALYLIKAILNFGRVENIIRYSIIGLILISIVFAVYKITHKNNKSKKRLSIFFVVMMIINVFLAYNLSTIYSTLSNLNKKVVYSVTLVTLKENSNTYSDIKNIKKKNIGILNKETDIELYNLSVLSINNNNLNNNTIIDNYHTEFTLIKDLLDKKIDVAFLPTNFKDTINRDLFEGMDAEKELSKLVTIEKLETSKEVSKEDEKLNAKPVDINKPFTVLFMGIDSTTEKLGSADSLNGDSLMVVTFNPKTMTLTMLSLPRDSYVYVTCMKTDNKLTHSAQRGTKCVLSTIEKLLAIKIDYYVKINFRGVVKLVDAVGGIEVDVPYNVCEQDSKRRFGNHIITVDKGRRVINGEQALAISRNRKVNADKGCSGKYLQGHRDDFTRGANQQLVIMGVIEKLKTYTNLTNFQGLLKLISNNIDTNMSEDTILSFYDLFKKILLSSSSDKLFNIQRLVLKGNSQRIYDERSHLVLDNIILNPNSLKAVKDAIKVNLGKSSKNPIKSFNYKYGEAYEKHVIGNITSGQKYYDLLPNFVGAKESYVSSFCKNKGLILKVEYKSDAKKTSGTVISQNYPEKKRIDYIEDNTLTIVVVNNSLDCLTSTSSVCNLPNFVGQKKVAFDNWLKKIYPKIEFTFDEEVSENPPGTIISQSIVPGTTVKEIIEGNLKIKLVFAKSNSP